jgi:hypothetical protein
MSDAAVRAIDDQVARSTPGRFIRRLPSHFFIVHLAEALDRSAQSFFELGSDSLSGFLIRHRVCHRMYCQSLKNSIHFGWKIDRIWWGGPPARYIDGKMETPD